jgi:hypothetical protein
VYVNITSKSSSQKGSNKNEALFHRGLLYAISGQGISDSSNLVMLS